jgi:hypothetical protein
MIRSAEPLPDRDTTSRPGSPGTASAGPNDLETAVPWHLPAVRVPSAGQAGRRCPVLADKDLEAGLDKAGVPPQTATAIVSGNSRSKMTALSLRLS